MVNPHIMQAHRKDYCYSAGCEYAAVERLNKDAVLPLLRALVRTPFFRCALEAFHMLVQVPPCPSGMVAVPVSPAHVILACAASPS